MGSSYSQKEKFCYNSFSNEKSQVGRPAPVDGLEPAEPFPGRIGAGKQITCFLFWEDGYNGNTYTILNE